MKRILLVVIGAVLGTVTFQTWQYCFAEESWTPATEAKLEKMVSLGWDSAIANELIVQCKATAKDPSRCVSIGNFIGWAESSGGKVKNVFGVLSGKKFATKREAVKDWVQRYNKHWYKMEKPIQFYGKGAVTGYCKSEKKTKGWCPIGLKNAMTAYNFFTK